MTETITFAEFFQANKIRMSAARTDHNPHMEEDRAHPMDHWKCLIRCGTRRMSVYFSMGMGHNGRRPSPADVLDCLASDASGIENAQSFEDWCGEYGYDTDSRKAHKTYKVCERQAAKLKALLGEDAYKQLLWHTERL
jgi:hypothetical protein